MKVSKIIKKQGRKSGKLDTKSADFEKTMAKIRPFIKKNDVLPFKSTQGKWFDPGSKQISPLIER